jgi:NTE family protein
METGCSVFGMCIRSIVICSVALMVLSAPAAAQESAKEPELVLVLSGGGARGAAHIGALKVLEELHIIPDMIVGTSIGSVVGGLYAAGWSPDEIHQLVLDIDWDEVFTDRVDRNQRSFRRKQDDRPYLIATRLHFDKKGFHLPSGMLGGQSLELLLRSLEARTNPVQDFDELPIPYRAVATDIEAGVPYVFDKGSLATAIRASMAIPGMFSPVMRDGQKLVDGGSTANLPVGIAQSLGADSIIAVDITSPLTTPGEELESFLKIIRQMNSMVTVGNRVEDVKKLRPGDVYVRPELGEIGFMDFDEVSAAVELGEAATRAKIDELRRFSSSESEWQEFLVRHRTRPTDTVHVDRVRLENSSKLRDEIAVSALGFEVPTELDPQTLRTNFMRLYHLRHSGVISYHIDDVDGERELVIESPPPRYGSNTLQFGIGFINDFRGDNEYSFTVRHRLLNANRYGAEWQNLLQLGSRAKLVSQFYQPLDNGLKWFVTPGISLSRFEQKIWFDGEPRAEYRLRQEMAWLEAGRVFGNWGELRLGGFYSENRGDLKVGASPLPKIEETRAGTQLRFFTDTEDSVMFPQSGNKITAHYQNSVESMGSDVAFERFFLTARQAWTVSGFTFHPYIEYGDNLGDTEDLYDLYSLGGLGRLSGLGTRELVGEKLAFARLTMRHRLFQKDIAGIRLRFYAGLALEAGNVYAHDDSVSFNSMNSGYSLFVGADTPIGPLFLGYGNTEGSDRVYIAIGDHF